MRVWFDRKAEERLSVSEHARKLVVALDADDFKQPRYARPRGVAFHQAQFPQECDECGLTFWATSEYASHRGCRGPARPATGFHTSL